MLLTNLEPERNRQNRERGEGARSLDLEAAKVHLAVRHQNLRKNKSPFSFELSFSDAEYAVKRFGYESQIHSARCPKRASVVAGCQRMAQMGLAGIGVPLN